MVVRLAHLRRHAGRALRPFLVVVSLVSASSSAAQDSISGIDVDVASASIDAPAGLGPGGDLLVLTSAGAAGVLGAVAAGAALQGTAFLFLLPAGYEISALAFGLAAFVLTPLVPLFSLGAAAMWADIDGFRGALAVGTAMTFGLLTPLPAFALSSIGTLMVMSALADPRTNIVAPAVLIGGVAAMLTLPIAATAIVTGLGAGMGYTAAAFLEGARGDSGFDEGFDDDGGYADGGDGR